jgi:phosphate transport system permease protein
MNSKRRFKWQKVEEAVLVFLMRAALFSVFLGLGWILYTLLLKGIPALSWELVTRLPQGGFYLGKGGGILNAIVGSLYLAGGGTLIAFIISFPIVFFMDMYLRRNHPLGLGIRLVMDILWGIPSIVYGAFAFLLMIELGLRASLLAGMLTLGLLETPIMVRSMDEIMRGHPDELAQSSLAVGATRLETLLQVVLRQSIPGFATAVLLAFGRGIGDAAAVLFTAGYTDFIPRSLLEPSASLPLAVFFQLGTPYPEVQQRAYASALILTLIILTISLLTRWISSAFGKYQVK